MTVGLGSETVIVDVRNLTVVDMISNQGPKSDTDNNSKLS